MLWWWPPRVELRPEFDFIDGKRTQRGYVAANTIEVRLDNLSRVGRSGADAAATGVARSLMMTACAEQASTPIVPGLIEIRARSPDRMR